MYRDNAEIVQKDDGLWWPAHIGGSMARYRKHRLDSDAAIRLCSAGRRRTAVQAGAHVGLWPLRLAEKFQHVHTFEPEPIMWRCLERNVAAQPKITAHNAGIADRAGKALLCLNGKNTGGSKVRTPTARDKTVEIDLVAIDDLGLDDVDLIYLDVEGLELAGVNGAVETIKRSRPIVGLESWKHGEKAARPEWQWTERSLIDRMAELGYREAARVSHDIVFAPR